MRFSHSSEFEEIRKARSWHDTSRSAIFISLASSIEKVGRHVSIAYSHKIVSWNKFSRTNRRQLDKFLEVSLNNVSTRTIIEHDLPSDNPLARQVLWDKWEDDENIWERTQKLACQFVYTLLLTATWFSRRILFLGNDQQDRGRIVGNSCSIMINHVTFKSSSDSYFAEEERWELVNIVEQYIFPLACKNVK